MTYVFDLHEDISDSIIYTARTDFFKRNSLHEGQNELNLPVNNQSDYYRLQEGGVKAIFGASCALDFDEKGEVQPSSDHYNEILQQLDLYHRLRAKRPDDISFILTKTDVSEISTRKLSMLLSLEGADSLADDTERIHTLFEKGVRSIGLTWSFTNDLAGGCDETGDLTSKGKKVIHKMEELGMLLDLAHINEQSFYSALSQSTQPVIVSHTACREVFDHVRNITDDQIKAIGKTGGVVGIAGVSKFFGENDIQGVVKHIQHVVDVIGIDHVAIGSDFGSMTTPKLLDNYYDVTCFPTLTTHLQEAGFSKEEIDKIAHTNTERVLKSVLPEK